MITQIQIDVQHNWFPSIDCEQHAPFLSIAEYYMIFSEISPSIIKNREIEIISKMYDVEFDFFGDSAIMPIFNLEKVYAYMLKKELSKK